MSVVESLWNMGLHGYSVIPCVVFDLPAVLTYSSPEALIYCQSTACICYTPTGLTDSLPTVLAYRVHGQLVTCGLTIHRSIGLLSTNSTGLEHSS